MDTILEGVDTLRPVQGHGVLLLGEDSFGDRGVLHLAPEAPPAPAMLAVSSKYGAIVAPSQQGAVASRVAEAESAIETAKGLTETEQRAAPLPAAVELSYPMPGPATWIALSHDEELVAVAQGGSVHLHRLAELVFDRSPRAYAVIPQNGLSALQWSRQPSPSSEPLLLALSSSKLSIYGGSDGRLIGSGTLKGALYAAWMPSDAAATGSPSNNSSTYGLAVACEDGAVRKASLTAAGSIAFDATSASMFATPQSIDGAGRSAHFVAFPAPTVAFIGWRPAPGSDPQAWSEPGGPPALAVAMYTRPSSSAIAVWSEPRDLGSPCPVDEFAMPPPDLTTVQYSVTSVSGGASSADGSSGQWGGLFLLACTLCNRVAVIGTGAGSGKGPADGANEPAGYYVYSPLEDRFQPRTIDSQMEFMQTYVWGSGVSLNSTAGIRPASAGIRGETTDLPPAPLLLVLCSHGVIVPFSLVGINRDLFPPLPPVPALKAKAPPVAYTPFSGSAPSAAANDGAPAAAPAPASSPFGSFGGFGTAAAGAAPSAAFSFGASTAPSSSSFSFGATPAPAPAASSTSGGAFGGFSFGATPAPAPAASSTSGGAFGGFSFGATPVPSSAASSTSGGAFGGIGFGAPAGAAASPVAAETSSSSAGAEIAKPASAVPPFGGFGKQPTFNFGAAPPAFGASTTSAPAFGASASTTAAAPAAATSSFSFGAVSSTPAATTATTTAAATPLSFATPAAGGFLFGSSVPAAAPAPAPAPAPVAAGAAPKKEVEEPEKPAPAPIAEKSKVEAKAEPAATPAPAFSFGGFGASLQPFATPAGAPAAAPVPVPVATVPVPAPVAAPAFSFATPVKPTAPAAVPAPAVSLPAVAVAAAPKAAAAPVAAEPAGPVRITNTVQSSASSSSYKPAAEAALPASLRGKTSGGHPLAERFVSIVTATDALLASLSAPLPASFSSTAGSKSSSAAAAAAGASLTYPSPAEQERIDAALAGLAGKASSAVTSQPSANSSVPAIEPTIPALKAAAASAMREQRERLSSAGAKLTAAEPQLAALLARSQDAIAAETLMGSSHSGSSSSLTSPYAKRKAAAAQAASLSATVSAPLDPYSAEQLRSARQRMTQLRTGLQQLDIRTAELTSAAASGGDRSGSSAHQLAVARKVADSLLTGGGLANQEARLQAAAAEIDRLRALVGLGPAAVPALLSTGISAADDVSAVRDGYGGASATLTSLSATGRYGSPTKPQQRQQLGQSVLGVSGLLSTPSRGPAGTVASSTGRFASPVVAARQQAQRLGSSTVRNVAVTPAAAVAATASSGLPAPSRFASPAAAAYGRSGLAASAVTSSTGAAVGGGLSTPLKRPASTTAAASPSPGITLTPAAARRNLYYSSPGTGMSDVRGSTSSALPSVTGAINRGGASQLGPMRMSSTSALGQSGLMDAVSRATGRIPSSSPLRGSGATTNAGQIRPQMGATAAVGIKASSTLAAEVAAATASGGLSIFRAAREASSSSSIDRGLGSLSGALDALSLKPYGPLGGAKSSSNSSSVAGLVSMTSVPAWERANAVSALAREAWNGGAEVTYQTYIDAEPVTSSSSGGIGGLPSYLTEPEPPLPVPSPPKAKVATPLQPMAESEGGWGGNSSAAGPLGPSASKVLKSSKAAPLDKSAIDSLGASLPVPSAGAAAPSSTIGGAASSFSPAPAAAVDLVTEQNVTALLRYLSAHNPAQAKRDKAASLWDKHGPAVWGKLEAKYPGTTAGFAPPPPPPPAAAATAEGTAAKPASGGRRDRATSSVGTGLTRAAKGGDLAPSAAPVKALAFETAAAPVAASSSSEDGDASKAAPAPGGFSFGAAFGAPAGAKEKEETKAATFGSGGLSFSFGAAVPAPASSSSTGFSFGASSSTTTSSSAGGGLGGFSFGGDKKAEEKPAASGDGANDKKADEAPSPIKPPAFSFGAPAPAPAAAADAVKASVGAADASATAAGEKKGEATKGPLAFSFGTVASKAAADATSGGGGSGSAFTFGTPAATPAETTPTAPSFGAPAPAPAPAEEAKKAEDAKPAAEAPAQASGGAFSFAGFGAGLTPAPAPAAASAAPAIAPAAATGVDEAAHKAALMRFYTATTPDAPPTAEKVDKLWAKYGEGIWEQIEKKRPGTTAGYRPAPTATAAAAAPAPAPATAAAPASSSGFGGFGAAFGSALPAFGVPAAAPAKAFGTAMSTGFGASTSSSTSSSSGGFAFGAPAPSPAPATSSTGGFGGIFGASITTTTAAAGSAAPVATGGIFGSSAAGAPAFGQPSAFGAAPAPTSSGGFGGFGAAAPAPAFGSTSGATAFGSPFGAAAAPAPAAAASSASPLGPSDVQAHKERLLAFFNTHNPSKANTVEEVWAKYGPGVWASLVKKYGADKVQPFTQGLAGLSGATPAPAPAPAPVFGSSSTAAPAQSSGFGGFGAMSSFGQTSAFGAATAPAPAPAAGGFGAFGATSSAPSTGFGGFGQPQQASTSTGFGGFGAFGGGATAPAPAAFGGFGAAAPAPAPTGFGGGGGFGAPLSFGGSGGLSFGSAGGGFSMAAGLRK